MDRYDSLSVQLSPYYERKAFVAPYEMRYCTPTVKVNEGLYL